MIAVFVMCSLKTLSSCYDSFNSVLLLNVAPIVQNSVQRHKFIRELEAAVGIELFFS